MRDQPTVRIRDLLTGGLHLSDGSKLEDPHSYFRRQLYSKPLEVMAARSVDQIQAVLDRETANIPSGGSSKQVDFLIWSRNLLSEAVTTAVYGPNFLPAFPRLIDALWELDDGVYKR